MADIHSLVKQNLQFRVLVDNQPISRGEIEDMSLLPKVILKGGAAHRLWTLEPIGEPTDGAPLLCRLRCDRAVVGHRDGRVFAFLIDDEPDAAAKWIVQPGQDVDGQTKLNIALADSPLAWRDPDTFPSEGGHPKQIPLGESFVPEFKFTLIPAFD